MQSNVLLLLLACCVLTTGCDAAKVKQLQDENKRLTNELQVMQKERDSLQQKVALAEEIRKGYEEAREKFQTQLAGLTSVLGGGAANPLPPFEALKNSDWVGNLVPGAATDLKNLKDLREIEGNLLDGLLGGQQRSSGQQRNPGQQPNAGQQRNPGQSRTRSNNGLPFFAV